MSSNLFLTGPRRCGKSTMIRACVKPHLAITGGFFVQRIMSEGKCHGFRLLELSARTAYELETEKKGETDLEELDNVFLAFTQSGRSIINPAVFDTAGKEILERSMAAGKRLIIMDELGRCEAEALMFQDKVLEILAADVPVLGVLKKEGNPFLDGIRRRKDVQILDFEQETAAAIRKRIEKFLQEQGLAAPGAPACPSCSEHCLKTERG